MIPSIPAVNKLSFDSSGNDGDDFSCLLDKYPMTDGGWAASTICLRKAFLNKPIIKARREDDNVECNVFPYKIKPGLAGMHPKSMTSLGITLEEFANGGAVRCVLCYNQLDGPYSGSGSGHDAKSNVSSLQPRIVSTSGAFKPLGKIYMLDFTDPNSATYSLHNFGQRITQQKMFNLFAAKRGGQYTSASYYMGQYTPYYFGEVGNFGAPSTAMSFGSVLGASDNIGNDESAVTGFKPDGANSSIHRNGVTIKTGNVGSNVPASGSSPQYGDYFMSSGLGLMTGPIIWNLSNSDIDQDKANEITQYLKDLIEI